MIFGILTMVITADTKEQLDMDTDAILSTARKRMCQMAILKYQQMDGLNTVLPIGTRKLNAFRTLTTESLAVFMPFKVQEIMDKGGIYFGENAISHNLIMCNKENLLNQSAFLLGVPGSGKSFSAKELMTFLMLNTEDDILVCDPEGEYAPPGGGHGEYGFRDPCFRWRAGSAQRHVHGGRLWGEQPHCGQVRVHHVPDRADRQERGGSPAQVHY